MVRDDKGQTPPVIQQFLVDLLAYNDNLGNKVRFPLVHPFEMQNAKADLASLFFNQYSDAHYVSSVMNALSHAFVKTLPREVNPYANELDEVEGNENLAPAVQEVERYMAADRLVPGYHNVVTIAGIEVRSIFIFSPSSKRSVVDNSRFVTVQTQTHSRFTHT